MLRFRARVSESIRIGPFRFRVSEPLGRGRVWGSATAGRGPFSVRLSGPLGGKHRRKETPDGR